MEYFREYSNSTKERKRKAQTGLWGIYKESQDMERGRPRILGPSRFFLALGEFSELRRLDYRVRHLERLSALFFDSPLLTIPCSSCFRWNSVSQFIWFNKNAFVQFTIDNMLVLSFYSCDLADIRDLGEFSVSYIS